MGEAETLEEAHVGGVGHVFEAAAINTWLGLALIELP